MGVLNLFIEHHGGNDFRLPHLRKAALRREGQLPITLPVTEAPLEYLDWNDSFFLLSALFFKHLETFFYIRLSNHRSGEQANFV